MEGSRRHHLGGRSEAREHGATGARRERGAGRPAAAAGVGRYLALYLRYICLSHSIAFVLILSRVDLTKESSRLGLPVRTVSKKERKRTDS